MILGRRLRFLVWTHITEVKLSRSRRRGPSETLSWASAIDSGECSTKIKSNFKLWLYILSMFRSKWILHKDAPKKYELTVLFLKTIVFYQIDSYLRLFLMWVFVWCNFENFSLSSFGEIALPNFLLFLSWNFIPKYEIPLNSKMFNHFGHTIWHIMTTYQKLESVLALKSLMEWDLI